MIKLKRFIPYGKYAIGFIIILFVINSFLKNFQDLKNSNFRVNLFYLIGSLIVLLLFLIFQLAIWHVISKKNSIAIKLGESIRFRMNAEFGKYIPGRITLYGILFYYYRQKNIPSERVILCSLNEAIASITGTILFVLVGSIFINIESVFYNGAMKVMILLLAIGLLLPQPQRYLFIMLSKISKFKDFGRSQKHGDRLLFALLFFLSWIIYSFSFILLVRGFYFVEYSKIITLAVIFCFSTLIGFLAFFVPAGLGVREGTLTILLAQILPLGAASFISVFSRIWLMSGEIILFIILFFVKVFGSREKTDELSKIGCVKT